jgi:prolyl oligopeptidase
MTLIMAEGTKRDGSNPTLATGYGGYGISSTPYFSANRMLWLEQGGIYVDTNLRGGSEFGSDWHEQGRLTQKQNVYDDFAAVLEHLVSRGYTSPGKLAIEGGSNGGLLMGAIINQHPGAVRAVISHVGVYDSLRSELEPNGAFNIPEFGTVSDRAQYRALRAYSPYHNVRPDSDFPSILLMTGEHDEAIEKLEFLIQRNGLLSVEILKRDPLWDPLREINAFKALIENPEYQINLDDN